MTLLKVLAGFISQTMTWLLASLRPLLNPFIGDRPIIPRTSGTTTSARTTATSINGSTGKRPHMRRKPFIDGQATPTTADTHLEEVQPYLPAVVDVLRVRHILLKASRNSIPIDLIDEILDHAEYWPHVAASKNSLLVARGASAYSDVLVIRTPPICSLGTHGSDQDSLGLPEPTRKHPAKKVVFKIRSRDQGWSGEESSSQGTYRNSYTWFDAQIDKQFRPIPHGETLSDVPWELSSTKFLEAWPEHRHQVDDEQMQAEQNAQRQENRLRTGPRQGTWENAPDTTETRPEPSSSEHQANPEIDSQPSSSSSSTSPSSSQPSTANNPEATQPRAFSHAYLQNHRYEAQYNVQARSQPTEHRVEWRWTDNTPADGPEADALAAIGRGRATGDGRFVRELRLGDCVSLWAKARYPQWRNHVEEAEVQVFFAL